VGKGRGREPGPEQEPGPGCGMKKREGALIQTGLSPPTEGLQSQHMMASPDENYTDLILV